MNQLLAFNRGEVWKTDPLLRDTLARRALTGRSSKLPLGELLASLSSD